MTTNELETGVAAVAATVPLMARHRPDSMPSYAPLANAERARL
jgi:hypothetical protein